MRRGLIQVLIFFLAFELFYFKVTSSFQKKVDPIFTLEEVVADESFQEKTVYNKDSIVSFKDEEVKPIVYDVNNYDLAELDVNEKKEKFVQLMLPTILIVKEEILEKKRKTEKIYAKMKSGKKLKKSENEFLERLLSEYKVEDDSIEELLVKLSPPPPAIVLGQAIIESGWGTSRFFKEANNVFGIWSFDETEPRVPSKFGYRNGYKVYLKKYNSLKECLEDYFYKIAVLSYYKKFREYAYKTENYVELTKHLENYSELKQEYVVRLNKIISENNLDSYDKYTLKR
jgi:Bax protein